MFPSDGSLMWNSMVMLAHFLKLFFCIPIVEGRDNVPRQGGLVFACNHNMGPDYVVLGALSPRQVYFMAKSEIFNVSPWLTRLLFSLGTFPIQRGENDNAAVTSAVELVCSGKTLGMFPEGTRSRTGQLQPGRSGATRIAMTASVPVVPVVVLNSEKIFPRKWLPWNRPVVTVRFGRPLHLEGDVEDSASVRHNTDDIMRAIAELLPPERRGAFALDSERIGEA
jgi:1-acyl-sn-glycerol-3-phosphate acyltransferase